MPRPTQVEIPDDALGDHDRHHLRVEDGAAYGCYKVDARGEQTARLPLEDGRPERSTGPVVDVRSGELDREPHPILDGRIDPVFSEKILHPIGESQRNCGKPHEPTPSTASA